MGVPAQGYGQVSRITSRKSTALRRRMKNQQFLLIAFLVLVTVVGGTLLHHQQPLPIRPSPLGLRVRIH